MAGKRGRSGRKPGSGKGRGMSATEHALRGSYQPARHGPLPLGVVPVPCVRRKPGAVAVPAPMLPVVTLTAEDCPAVLTAAGRALWAIVVAQRPTDKLLGAFVAAYIEASLLWQRATAKITASGDYGKIDGRAGVNPYVRIRRDAEGQMARVAAFLGWQPVQGVQAPAEIPQSKFELFLAASRGKA